MKLIIAGSRTLKPSIEGIDEFIYLSELFRENIWEKLEIVSGGAVGVDTCAQEYAVWHQKEYHHFPADWEKHGKAAGPIRNKQMAEFGDALLLIWDGESKGSLNMKIQMEKLKKPVYEVIIKLPTTAKVLYGST